VVTAKQGKAIITGEGFMSEQHANDTIRTAVREHYAEAATRGQAKSAPEPDCGCGPSSGGTGEASSCCGTSAAPSGSCSVGYSEAELASIPDAADLGLGSGNPGATADLRTGETVLDLGAGGGLDCFLAAQRVGETGHVIGVDMTSQMVSRARANASNNDYDNVEFRLGEIENLPVADETVDVILSNCVINLSPDKPAVYREAYRVLKPGGRLSISDVVATTDLPDSAREDLDLVAACVSGAATFGRVEQALSDAGFEGIRIRPKDETAEVIDEWTPGSDVRDYVLSAIVQAVKPAA
tara:strand:+ start:2365 stop:3255 length:891 start_codon:yes stop_codon:yes gene_type:complete